MGYSKLIGGPMPENSNPNEDLGGLAKLFKFDPALVAAVVTVITAVAAAFGVELTHGRAELFAMVALGVVNVAALLWARRKTMSKHKVLAYMPDPVDRPRAVAAGPAVTAASDVAVLNAARTQGYA
jgi:hypothetical protein